MLKGFGLLTIFVAVLNFVMYASLIIVAAWAVGRFILP
jgi:hypothetical protein